MPETQKSIGLISALRKAGLMEREEALPTSLKMAALAGEYKSLSATDRIWFLDHFKSEMGWDVEIKVA